MKNKLVPFYETSFILIGELIVSLIVCAVYLIIGKFSYKVVTGVALGTLVTVLNFLFLSISTNKAFDKAMEARGTKEMDEDEIEEFAESQKAQLQNAVKLSFILRTFSMMGALILAFVLEQFDVIATLIPLVMLRPIITVESLIRAKFQKGDK